MTTDASSNLQNVHRRMPCIIKSDEHKFWLEGKDINTLDTSIGERIKFFEVSTYVNNPQNDNERCIEI